MKIGQRTGKHINRLEQRCALHGDSFSGETVPDNCELTVTVPRTLISHTCSNDVLAYSVVIPMPYKARNILALNMRAPDSRSLRQQTSECMMKAKVKEQKPTVVRRVLLLDCGFPHTSSG